jgi:hypothetical protein
MPKKVRVTMFEDPIEVPDDEVEVLRSQGLIHEEAAPEPAPQQSAAKASPKKAGE